MEYDAIAAMGAIARERRVSARSADRADISQRASRSSCVARASTDSIDVDADDARMGRARGGWDSLTSHDSSPESIPDRPDARGRDGWRAIRRARAGRRAIRARARGRRRCDRRRRRRRRADDAAARTTRIGRASFAHRIARRIARRSRLGRVMAGLRSREGVGTIVVEGADDGAASAASAVGRVTVDFASQLMGFVAFTWEGALWAAVLVTFVMSWMRRIARRRLRTALVNAEMKHSLDSQFTVVEHGAMDWINSLLAHTWACTVGSFADEQARDVARGIIADLGDSKPSFVKEVTLTDLTLGSTPPRIRLFTTRYNPTLDYLQFEFDLDWFADAAHGRLLTKIKIASSIPSLTIPIHLTDFGLRGRLLMGMRLTKRVPGVSGVDISFRGAPKVDVSVRPVGLPIADVPGLYEWIMGKIEEIICKKFLEPRRLYVDVEGKFLQKMAGADFLGPGGTLVCRVMTVKGVPRGKGSGFPWCEISYNGRRKKTSTRPLAAVMEYGGVLAFALPETTDWKSSNKEDNGSMDLGAVRVRIMDRAPVGSDVIVIGEAVFGAHRRTDSATHQLTLSLGSHERKSKYGVSAKVPITAQMEWEVLPPIERWNPTRPAVVESRSSIPLKHARESGVNDDDDDDEDDDEDEDGDDIDEECGNDAGGNGDDDDGSDVFSGSSLRSEDAARRSVDGLAPETSGDAFDSATEHVLQLAKLRILMQKERESSDSTIEGLKHELSIARETLQLERERRAQELKRALLEGVKVHVHSRNSRADLSGKDEMFIRYHGYNCEFTLHKKHGVKAKKIHTLKILHVSHASTGTKHFTLGVSKSQDERESAKAKSARARQIQSLPAARCFTIIFLTEEKYKQQCEQVREANSEVKKSESKTKNLEQVREEEVKFEPMGGLADTGLLGLDLELPIEGNGRSAREWVDGINALRDVYLATEFGDVLKKRGSMKNTSSLVREGSLDLKRANSTSAEEKPSDLETSTSQK